MVYSIPARTGLPQDDCDDVFQHTFVALASNLDRLRDGALLAKWLAVTASRESLRLKRIRSGTPTVSASDVSLEEVVANEEANAEEEAIRSVEAHEVRIALADLPGKCKRLLSMLFGENTASYQQISSDLGIPIGAIGPTRARCIDKLRTILQSRGFFDD